MSLKVTHVSQETAAAILTANTALLPWQTEPLPQLAERASRRLLIHEVTAKASTTNNGLGLWTRRRRAYNAVPGIKPVSWRRLKKFWRPRAGLKPSQVARLWARTRVPPR